MPFFGQELFEQAAAKGPLTEPAYLEALATCRRLSRAEGIDAVMDEHRLDALVAPSNAPAWRIDHANGDHDVGGNSTPAAVAGYPNVTVPMGFALRPPDRDLVHGTCLERGDADPARVGVRARHAPPAFASGGACSRRWRTRT